jgi:hypothetical protein
MTDEAIKPGDVIHTLVSGVTLSDEPVPGVDGGGVYSGRVLYSGEEFVVTEGLIIATTDRTGKTWLSMSEDEQLARWQEVRFRRGPRPEGTVVGADDSSLKYRQALAARERALATSDPGDRTLALRQVRADYGDILDNKTASIVTTPGMY